MDTIRNCISFRTIAAAKVIARLSRSRLAPFDVTPIQFAVLQAVSETESQTAADVGAALMTDSAALVGVIDRLAATGLLSRAAHPTDRRIERLVPTARGATALPPMPAAMEALNAESDAVMPPRAQTVRDSLRHLADLPPNRKD